MTLLNIFCSPVCSQLYINFSDVAELVFNRCTVSNETKDRHDTQGYSITFEYEFIEDFQDAKGDICSSFFKRYILIYKQNLHLQ